MTRIRSWFRDTVERIVEDHLESRFVEMRGELSSSISQTQNGLAAEIKEREDRILGQLKNTEKAIQRRLKGQLTYYLEKKIKAPDILVQEELQPEIGTDYILVNLEVKNNQPIMFGGNLNLANLGRGDAVNLVCLYTDHKGSESTFFRHEIRGPLDDPFYIVEPQVVTAGARIVFRALQGRSRPFTYCFYRWI